MQRCIAMQSHGQCTQLGFCFKVACLLGKDQSLQPVTSIPHIPRQNAALLAPANQKRPLCRISICPGTLSLHSANTHSNQNRKLTCSRSPLKKTLRCL